MATALRLGDILVRSGIISADKLQEALKKQQRDKGEFLGQTLVRLGIVREDQIVQALSQQLLVPFFSMSDWPRLAEMSKSASTLIPEAFARKNYLFPIQKKESVLVVAITDPTNLLVIDNLQKMTGLDIESVIATKTDVENVLNKIYSQGGALKSIVESMRTQGDPLAEQATSLRQVNELAEGEGNVPVVQLVNLILDEAIRCRASDIHLEPYEKTVAIRFRIDGVLKFMAPPDKGMFISLISRLKILSGMDIAEKRLPQDGGFSASLRNRVIDFRVSTIPTIYGEKMVLRILDRTAISLDLAKLGFEKKEIDLFRQGIEHPHGLILITGPTGSGKTTTLYSALNELKGEDVNILTVEDPVEYQLDGVNQVQVKANIGLTFASALRAFLRQDPDIILLGEIRDLETAQICIRSALTGHLVFSTIHTNDAISSISRLKDIGIESFLVASSITMIVAQRLLRVLCPKCKKQVPLARGILPHDVHVPDSCEFVFEAVGCEHCLGTGYYGRMAVYEIVLVNPGMREMIAKNMPIGDLRAYSVAQGFESLVQSAFKKVFQGVSSIDEVQRVILMGEG